MTWLVASQEGVEANQPPPLTETIDPDALLERFDRTRGPLNAETHVSLEYSGRTVKSYPDQTVVIEYLRLLSPKASGAGNVPAS